MAASANVEQVSKALNVTVRRVNQLVHEGMPRAERGAYDLGGCMLWYIRYLQKALAKKATMGEDGEISSLQGSRQELLKVQIERERFELEREKRLHIPIATHEFIVSDLIQETKARVRAVGSRISQDLVGETSRLMIQAKLDKAHDEALRQLAKLVPRIPAEGEAEGAAEPVEAPAAQHQAEATAPKKGAKQKPKPKAKAAKRGR